MTACLANKLSVSVVGKTLWPVVNVTQDIIISEILKDCGPFDRLYFTNVLGRHW